MASQALCSHPQEPLHVLYGSGGYVHPSVEILDPVDRYLRDAIPSLLGLQQQLLSYAVLGCLEAALSVGEAVAEHSLDKQVVAPRNQLALPLARNRRPL